MAIPEGYKHNFETLCRARDDRALCIMECKDRVTGKMVVAVCAAWTDEEGIVHMVPVAKMFDGDPYEEIDPPEVGDGKEADDG